MSIVTLNVEEVEGGCGRCLGSFGCPQEFLEESWVEKSEKLRFSIEEEKRRHV